jgi:hypothetical protein
MPEQKSGSAHSQGREKSLIFQIAPVLQCKRSSSAMQRFCNIEIVLIQKNRFTDSKKRKHH